MKDTARFFQLFADETRLRMLMLLGEAELCVCQIMAVLGISQPLVSRNMAMLDAAGLVDERRDGKLVFYVLKKRLPPRARAVMKVLRDELKDAAAYGLDLKSLADCREFQEKTGRCDMKTFLAYMDKRRKKVKSGGK